ncbi:cAMP-specific 3',5'-cyclic phosphodiesterase 4D [Channa argus]|uniref:cAMP-specific 3',5'-cyclic phosphodiesterase 4D n=1 Tax=Channa argus TaxID=215402 RepID=A0A6G1Q0B4_CHAAH|nr:cAMP-specific 3',5'-cyclic phosphodiesterase 4D [Channa argus]
MVDIISYKEANMVPVLFLSFGLNFVTVSDDSSDSPEPGPVTCMEPFLVRRLSCRTVQLPPLVFRQAEQYYCDRKPEPDTVTAPPRPTTLPLRTPPLIAITSADTTRHDGITA